MRAVHIALVPAIVLTTAAACAGNDPGANDNAGVSGGSAADGMNLAGSGAGAGGMSPGAAGTLAMTAGQGGSAGASAGTTAGDGGSSGASAGSDGVQAGSSAPAATEGSYFPLATGNSWTFRVTEAGMVTTKTQTISALEPVGGSGPNKDQMAYRAVTEKDDGGDETVSWQAEVDGKIVRYREQSFMASSGELELEEHWDPYKLRVDASQARLMAGVAWTETYSETKLPVGMAPATATANDKWRVIALDESVTVPAGTFQALVIEKMGGTPKRYWFVRGVGKVKETGTQTEELQSYEIMGE